MRVGSFTHEGEMQGFYHGISNVLQPAAKPLAFRFARADPDYRWDVGPSHGLTVDDYLARQRIMGLILVKDGVIQLERYQYDRKPTDRFVSHSMAKSITALAIGIALADGKIRSLDDPAEQYARKLRGTLYGGTSLRNLLRMASARAISRLMISPATRGDLTWVRRLKPARSRG
jgi:CubicO group peptidase (beta-lactamase class C family)